MWWVIFAWPGHADVSVKLVMEPSGRSRKRVEEAFASAMHHALAAPAGCRGFAVTVHPIIPDGDCDHEVPRPPGGL